MQFIQCEGCGKTTTDNYPERCDEGWGRWICHYKEHDYCPVCAERYRPPRLATETKGDQYKCIECGVTASFRKWCFGTVAHRTDCSGGHVLRVGDPLTKKISTMYFGDQWPVDPEQGDGDE